ncbi:MAG TPA: hypothetical protein VK002_03735 [Rubricoccaceae bacterium]|nr:hypothetical protein [Rubricoccaceae bacterium]
MHLLTLLLLVGLSLSAPPARAQQPVERDSLTASAAGAHPAPTFSTPVRRCRDERGRRAGTPPVAQARCSGGFGAPTVPSARRADLVDARLHARLRAAIVAALDDRAGQD